jgi:hypothetical protein
MDKNTTAGIFLEETLVHNLLCVLKKFEELGRYADPRV